MKTVISEEDLTRLANASINSIFRTKVANYVCSHFRSMHYKSSKLICDCVVLNLVLNDVITPTSANEILLCMHRKNKAIYTTVESAYFPIEDDFIEYAKSVLGEDYSAVRALNMRTTHFIVYVISLDASKRTDLNRDEIYMNAYTYAELAEKKLPHY